MTTLDEMYDASPAGKYQREQAAEVRAQRRVFDLLQGVDGDGPQCLRRWARRAHAARVVADTFHEGDDATDVVNAALNENERLVTSVASNPAGRLGDVALKLATLVQALSVEYRENDPPDCHRIGRLAILAGSALADAVLIGDRPIDPLRNTNGRRPAGGER